MRVYQSQILEDSIYVSVFRLAKLISVRAEVNGCTLGGKPPGEKRAAGDGVLEPGVVFVRYITVEKNFDGLLELAGELANL